MGFGTEIIFAFEYDAVSNTFRPADLSDKPPQGRRRQMRVHVPDDGAEAGPFVTEYGTR